MVIYHTLSCRRRNTEMPKPQLSLTQGWLGESHHHCPCLTCHILAVCSPGTVLDRQYTHSHLSGTEAPAFSGEQLLTMSRAVLVGLLASQMADLLWKVTSGPLSKDCKFTQTDWSKNCGSFLNPPNTPSFLTCYCRYPFRHISVGLASVRGGSYGNLPLMTKIWVSTNTGLDLGLQLMFSAH